MVQRLDRTLLYTVFCNFLKFHKTLRLAPPMEVKVMDRLLMFEAVVTIIER